MYQSIGPDQQFAHDKPPIIGKVATLCDEPAGLTCSVDAARRARIANEVIFCESFEIAAEKVKQEDIDALLVPAAYPGLNRFIMDSSLQVFHSFVQKIPPLVYAMRADASGEAHRSAPTRLYHHVAVTPLIAEIEVIAPATRFVPVSSNSEACKKLLADDGDGAACITNEICSLHYGLHVVQVLRQGIAMPWILFRQSRGSVA
ncbi:hypothetical protein LPW26_03540 [Rhodopseudomonas sp. HC1]|uniref:hypothetical protein n=1 Tax=Rhodopseudomonas infernalis TaxID=2897386 RepID=UPI001EE7FC1C|nr:hypothetical protein [Rhodopseudomonas infernalis]MCG6203700.1 hypothetical protein [Rhodopseudomonas infernalis]